MLREEHGALGKSFHDGETGVQDGTLEHFVHMLHLGSVGAGDEGRAAGDKLGHGVDGAVNCSTGVGLGLRPMGVVGEVWFLVRP